MSFFRIPNITFKVKVVMVAIATPLLVFAPYMADVFILRLLTLALISSLFAMSVDLMAGYAGLVTLGHAGVLGSAMYGVGYVAAKTEGGIPSQILVGFVAGMIASVIFGVMAMRSTGVYFIMITIAQGMIIWGLASLLVDITGAENGLLGIRRPVSIENDVDFYWVTLAVVAVASIALYVVVRSPFGFALKGLRGSETRIRMLGHNSAFLKFYMFVVSGFFATVAGILLVYLNEFVSPSDVILGASALPVLMSILGGIGTLVGPVIGAFVIVFLRNWVSIRVDRWPTLMGVIFILVVLFAQEGLVGGVKNWWYRQIAIARGDGPNTELASDDGPSPDLAAPELTMDTS
ncbi:MAG: branched-chain amino acid ABC transporter permease [Acidimicrobiales bacterium]